VCHLTSVDTGVPSTVAGATGIADGGPAASPAARLTLRTVAPNPVGAGEPLRLTYSVPAQNAASLRLYDVSGRLVTTLAPAAGSGPERILDWTARDAAGRPLPAGVYLLELASEQASTARKIMVVK